jgi:hypothetical protein
LIIFSKSKKSVFIDEVSNYLSFLEDINNEKILKENSDLNNLNEKNAKNISSSNNIQLGDLEKNVNK